MIHQAEEIGEVVGLKPTETKDILSSLLADLLKATKVQFLDDAAVTAFRDFGNIADFPKTFQRVKGSGSRGIGDLQGRIGDCPPLVLNQVLHCQT